MRIKKTYYQKPIKEKKPIKKRWIGIPILALGLTLFPNFTDRSTEKDKIHEETPLIYQEISPWDIPVEQHVDYIKTYKKFSDIQSKILNHHISDDPDDRWTWFAENHLEFRTTSLAKKGLKLYSEEQFEKDVQGLINFYVTQTEKYRECAKKSKRPGKECNGYKDYIEMFSEILTRSTRFDDIIEKAVSQSEHLTESFLRSHFAVESGWEWRICPKSYMGAFGIAQFIKKTARQEELVVNSYINESCNPVKAIMAGASHLDKLIEENEGNVNFGLIAYNAGRPWVESINNFISECKEAYYHWDINHFEDFIFNDKDCIEDYLWFYREYLPRETESHIIKVHALERMYKNAEEHDLKIEHEKLFTDDIKRVHIVRRGESLYKIARENGCPLYKVLHYNPHLNNENRISVSTELLVPHCR